MAAVFALDALRSGCKAQTKHSGELDGASA